METYCKLDYMTRRMNINDKKEVYGLIGPNSDFGILDCEFFLSLDNYEEFLQKKDFELEFIAGMFTRHFSDVNVCCKRNKMYPIFPNVKINNIVENVKIREEIIKEYPEEELNRFFGTKSFYAYIPPVYDPTADPEKTDT